MNRRIYQLTMASIVLVAALGCGSPGGIAADLDLPEPIELTLGVGETLPLGQMDGTLTLLGVPSDSRCPIDVTCVWAGDVEVRIQLTGTDAISDPLAVHTTIEPRTVQWSGLKVSITSVTPAATSESGIAANAYRVTFRVESQ